LTFKVSKLQFATICLKTLPRSKFKEFALDDNSQEKFFNFDSNCLRGEFRRLERDVGGISAFCSFHDDRFLHLSRI
jgi:hypothetical protein